MPPVMRTSSYSLAIFSCLLIQCAAIADATISGLDALILDPVHNDNPTGDLVAFGAFDNNANPGAVTFNGFDSFTIDAQDTGSTAFGGIGARIGGEFGTTFDPSNYKLEFTYKLGPNNAADKVHIIMSQHDGFDGFSIKGEDFTFAMSDLIGSGSTTNFTTLSRDLTRLPNPETGSVFEPWDVRQQTSSFDLDGDGAQDYNVAPDGFQDGAPNGLWRMQIQSIFGSSERINLEVKDLRLVPKTPEPEVARFDGNTGHARTVDFYAANVDRDGPNILIDGTVASQFASGFAFTSMKTPVTSFDGNTHAIEITAKLGPNNTMPGVSVILKDLDGNDVASGEGAEEWAYFFEESEFNTSTFTTLTRAVSLPDSGAPSLATAAGFSNSGDGSISDFDLYQMFIANAYGASFPDPTGRLDIEIESVKIVPLSAEDADFDGDGGIDGADFLTWQRNAGTMGGAGLSVGDANGDGNVDGLDLDIWENQYGTTPLLRAAEAVPEPSSFLLITCGGLLYCQYARSRQTRGRS